MHHASISCEVAADVSDRALQPQPTPARPAPLGPPARRPALPVGPQDAALPAEDVGDPAAADLDAPAPDAARPAVDDPGAATRRRAPHHTGHRAPARGPTAGLRHRPAARLHPAAPGDARTEQPDGPHVD